MRISELKFTPEMLENGWKGHRIEMPKTDALRYVSNPKAAKNFITAFGNVEIVFDEYYRQYKVPAFAEGRAEASELKRAYCERWGSN
jgi:hypothetical protein